MSLRPLLRQTQLRRVGVRSIQSSAPKRAAHGGHGAEEDQSDTYTKESFLNPKWRNAFLLFTTAALIFPYLPTPSKSNLSPSLSPDAFQDARRDVEGELPWLTRWFVRETEKASVWKERADRHLELTKEEADRRLLFQEAERPRVLRMRYPR
ncbi:hypothetical protein L198_07908 [Cryptococcus wingfieldii CBS 7118]|uniref:Uncharacterized protein n=1 Tax=Cryptococcus wingfieldii CBS 7118 TaxID=1295528 RepID=A0A1E3HS15_9TREE|nr:hypothetical protein L198_07908 [Cryptococcus wingfieldii CBS 7118]ODN79158.1 hypothetical protein L198_07908 [Cryptococcus wingfieldii CBS 7118]